MAVWTASAGAAIVALGVLFAPALQTKPAAAFVVIVNVANPVQVLPVADVRRIFMKQMRMWPHGESIVPVDWDATSPVREAFSQQMLARSVREMADYWVQQAVTQGLAPPSTQRSSRALLRFVSSVPGAIAYVPPGEADETVAVIKITGMP